MDSPCRNLVFFFMLCYTACMDNTQKQELEILKELERAVEDDLALHQRDYRWGTAYFTNQALMKLRKWRDDVADGKTRA